MYGVPPRTMIRLSARIGVHPGAYMDRLGNGATLRIEPRFGLSRRVRRPPAQRGRNTSARPLVPAIEILKLRFRDSKFKLIDLEAAPWQVVTDKPRSYGAAKQEVLRSVWHVQDRWRNNWAEVSHEVTRQREWQMRRFKSMQHAQRFVSSHGVINNLFRLCRHGMMAEHY